MTAKWAVLFCLATGGRLAFGEEAPVFPLPAPDTPVVPTNGGGPKIQFAAPVYDFGKVNVGEVVKHDFVFTNTGNQLLEIKEVKGQCSCTAAANYTRQVEPGARGVIPLEFYSRNFTGPVVKKATVTSNDPSSPTTTLEIRGTVWRPIEITPASALLTGVLDSPTNDFRVIRIVNQESQPLTLSAPVSSHRSIAAELRTNRLGREYELIVRLLPPVGEANVFGEITLKTSSAAMPVLNIPAWAVAQPAVMALPSPLILPPGPASNAFTQSVSIRSLWDQTLKLSDAVINGAGVGVKVVELQPGRFFTLLLTFPRGFQLVQGQSLELSVKSNHPRFPVIKVPVGQRSSLAPPLPVAQALKPVPPPPSPPTR